MKPAWISRMKDRQERVRRADYDALRREYLNEAQRRSLEAWRPIRPMGSHDDQPWLSSMSL